jgi:hypothetical protein
MFWTWRRMNGAAEQSAHSRLRRLHPRDDDDDSFSG